MRRQQKRLDMQVAARLGATPSRLREIQSSPSVQVGQQRLAELKELVRRTFKSLAFELHPDRHQEEGEGDLQRRTEDLQKLQEARDFIEHIQVMQRPRPVFVPVTVVHFQVPWASGTATPVTTATTTLGNGWRPVSWVTPGTGTGGF